MEKRTYLNKDQIQEEFKVIGAVAEDVLKKKGPYTFQLGFTVITNGKAVSKSKISDAFKAIEQLVSNGPKDWLYQPQIMVQSSDVAGSDMQEALTARQQAKAAIIKPPGLVKPTGKKVG